MLVLGEDEGGAGYLGDAAGAGGDVLEGCPALGEQGEPAFPLTAQFAQQRVAGAGKVAGRRVFLGVLRGDEDADAGAVVARRGAGVAARRG